MEGVISKVKNGGYMITGEEWGCRIKITYFTFRTSTPIDFLSSNKKILPTVHYFQQQSGTEVSQGLSCAKTKAKHGSQLTPSRLYN